MCNSLFGSPLWESFKVSASRSSSRQLQIGSQRSDAGFLSVVFAHALMWEISSELNLVQC